MIQVATGRDLGEASRNAVPPSRSPKLIHVASRPQREESTLQALQGKSTVLCAVPLGYCMVHADPAHGPPNRELEKEIENEFTGGRDLVTPKMTESDPSDLSDVASGRSVSARY